jgi:hypothetical protein
MFDFACPVKLVFNIYPGFKTKKVENFNHPGTICRAYGAGRNTLSNLRINPPKYGGGLKFEPDAGIGQKGAFCNDLILYGNLIFMRPPTACIKKLRRFVPIALRHVRHRPRKE